MRMGPELCWRVISLLEGSSRAGTVLRGARRNTGRERDLFKASLGWILSLKSRWDSQL